MSAQEETSFLKSQLEGLESIFLELLPSGVSLKRRDIQDYYDNRFGVSDSAQFVVSRNELRRQFNTKANQVRNIVDNAETLGSVQNYFNLVYAGSSLPHERTDKINTVVSDFCQSMLHGAGLRLDLLREILLSGHLSKAEARVLLGSTMFVLSEEISFEDKDVPVKELLDQLVELIVSGNFLSADDPFLVEARNFSDSMSSELAEIMAISED
jgi:hypothetical protein